MEKVSIIIVNWNTGSLLKKCLESITKLPEQELLGSVMVIDNASGDSSMDAAEAVAQTSPYISLVRSGVNLGFARANNVGIARLKEAHANDHVLLLNPDTEMKPGSLKALHDALTRHADVGIVGPKLLNPDGSLQPSVRRFPTFAVLAAMLLKLNRFIPGMGLWKRYMCEDFDYNKEQIAEQVMGACFLIRNKTLQEVGELDTQYWVWFEEVDFALRAKQKNWKTLYTPSGEVIHVGGASFHQLIGFKKSLPFINSALIYASKHFSALHIILLYMLLPFAFLLTIPAAFVHKTQQVHTAEKL